MENIQTQAVETKKKFRIIIRWIPWYHYCKVFNYHEYCQTAYEWWPCKKNRIGISQLSTGQTKLEAFLKLIFKPKEG